MLLIIHTICLATGSYPLSKRFPYRGQTSTASLKFYYRLFSLRPSSSCLHLLPRLSVPSIFPSITRFRSQFIHNMWPIQLAYLRTTVRGVLQLLCFVTYVTKIIQTDNNLWERSFITVYVTSWRHVSVLIYGSQQVIYTSIIYRSIIYRGREL